MLKAFVADTAHLSRAMTRVADAVARHAPPTVEITTDRPSADLILMHVVGFPEAAEETQNILACGKRYAILQYCLRSTQCPRAADWLPIWNEAALAWSYYDLQGILAEEGVSQNGARLYCSPLGTTAPFTDDFSEGSRDVGIMTSGYVSATCGEAIEEVAIAAARLGMQVVHLGPEQVEGMGAKPSGWRAVLGIDDGELARLYRRSRWVSGLRHIEGFELPVLEGLMCGARPIVFDRPEMRRWYDGHAAFVPECSGEELVQKLVEILQTEPEPIGAAERGVLLGRFDWAKIVGDFWELASGS